MPAHRRPRPQNVSAADGLDDVAVLALERLAVGALRHPWPAANRLPRNDEASEMFQKAPELRIPGRVRDAAMECKILRDCVLAAFEHRLDGLEAFDDPADLRGRAAIGGEAGSFDLDTGTQLHDVEHRPQRRQRVDV